MNPFLFYFNWTMQTLWVQSEAGEHMTIANMMENTSYRLPGSISTSCNILEDDLRSTWYK